MNDSQRAANFVRQWNADRAAQSARDRQYQMQDSGVTPDGKFGMDGYTICGAIVGGIYGGLNAGIIGGLIGAAVGAVLVLVVLGPFWLLHRTYKRAKYGPEMTMEEAEAMLQAPAAPAASTVEQTPASPAVSGNRVVRQLKRSAGVILLRWTLLGALLGGALGAWFAGAIDLAEETAGMAAIFAVAGAIGAFVMRGLLLLIWRRK